MNERMTPLRLSADEDVLFRKIYVKNAIPRGQYKKHPSYLCQFADQWNRLSGRSDSPQSVLHFMDTQQKITARLKVPWPVFEGAHRNLPPMENLLQPGHDLVIRKLYQELIIPLNIGTDTFAYREDLIDQMATAFRKATDYYLPGMFIAAWIEARRKEGTWLTLRDATGFDDLTELG